MTSLASISWDQHCAARDWLVKNFGITDDEGESAITEIKKLLEQPKKPDFKPWSYQTEIRERDGYFRILYTTQYGVVDDPRSLPLSWEPATAGLYSTEWLDPWPAFNFQRRQKKAKEKLIKLLQKLKATHEARMNVPIESGTV